MSVTSHGALHRMFENPAINLKNFITLTLVKSNAPLSNVEGLWSQWLE
jgi:hypothetical protein